MRLTQDGNTPLMFAAERGPIRIVEALLSCGAAVNAKTKVLLIVVLPPASHRLCISGIGNP